MNASIERPQTGPSNRIHPVVIGIAVTSPLPPDSRPSNGPLPPTSPTCSTGSNQRSCSIIVAVDAALAVLLALTLGAYDCGRITNGGVVEVVFILFSIPTLGAFYWIPGLIAGFLASKFAPMRSTRLWLSITLALVAALVIAVAFQSPTDPTPFPAHCRVDM